MRGIDVLKRHGVEFNTLTDVNRGNVREPKRVYRFLIQLQTLGYNMSVLRG